MNYFDHISTNISESLCVVLLLVLCVTAIVIFSRKGVIRIQLRRLLRVMFVEYLVLLFCSTVIFREEMPEAGVKFTLFDGYFRQNMDPLKDALLNIAIFIPIGLCTSVFLRYPKWQKTLLLSASLSCTIELSQYVLSRGWCDTNDVMNNIIGGMIGWGLYVMMLKTPFIPLRRGT